MPGQCHLGPQHWVEPPPSSTPGHSCQVPPARRREGSAGGSCTCSTEPAPPGSGARLAPGLRACSAPARVTVQHGLGVAWLSPWLALGSQLDAGAGGPALTVWIHSPLLPRQWCVHAGNKEQHPLPGAKTRAGTCTRVTEGRRAQAPSPPCVPSALAGVGPDMFLALQQVLASLEHTVSARRCCVLRLAGAGAETGTGGEERAQVVEVSGCQEPPPSP